MKILISVIAAIIFSQPLLAAVMESTNYSIDRDSVNFGGGASGSANYSQENTLGEVGTGFSDSANFSLRAGYQQMDQVFISISTVSDVVLSPAIDGTVGGTANGSATVTVTTDNPLGYELYIKASSSPALVSGANFFDDYTPVGADPDFGFSVAASDAEFAFSPEGNDVASEYLDNGATCNVGLLDTVNSCWRGLTTANELIAESNTNNQPAGTDTVIKFRVESGASNLQAAGVYTATTTVTAISL
jgi:hypothetical protein